MRENRTYGSEGGAIGNSTDRSYPYKCVVRPPKAERTLNQYLTVPPFTFLLGDLQIPNSLQLAHNRKLMTAPAARAIVHGALLCR